MEKCSVNKKQFHFLLVQFLAKHRILQKWYEESKKYKLEDKSRINTYRKYHMGEGDDFSTFLYKCIDIYIGETGFMYGGCIYGFFSFIPSGGIDGHAWVDFWRHYSKLWEKETRFIKYMR